MQTNIGSVQREAVIGGLACVFCGLEAIKRVLKQDLIGRYDSLDGLKEKAA